MGKSYEAGKVEFSYEEYPQPPKIKTTERPKAINKSQCVNGFTCVWPLAQLKPGSWPSTSTNSIAPWLSFISRASTASFSMGFIAQLENHKNKHLKLPSHGLIQGFGRYWLNLMPIIPRQYVLKYVRLSKNKQARDTQWVPFPNFFWNHRFSSRGWNEKLQRSFVTGAGRSKNSTSVEPSLHLKQLSKNKQVPMWQTACLLVFTQGRVWNR